MGSVMLDFVTIALRTDTSKEGQKAVTQWGKILLDIVTKVGTSRKHSNGI